MQRANSVAGFSRFGFLRESARNVRPADPREAGRAADAGIRWFPSRRKRREDQHFRGRISGGRRRRTEAESGLAGDDPFEQVDDEPRDVVDARVADRDHGVLAGDVPRGERARGQRHAASREFDRGFRVEGPAHVEFPVEELNPAVGVRAAEAERFERDELAAARVPDVGEAAAHDVEVALRHDGGVPTKRRARAASYPDRRRRAQRRRRLRRPSV
jgi:hypothetical protein